MDSIWLGELIVAYICLTALWTHHVFQKTGSVEEAFVKGFAVATSIATLVFVAIYVPDEWIPRRLDRVLLPLLAFAVVLATLTYGRFMMLLVRNFAIKFYRGVWRWIGKSGVRLGSGRVSILRKK